MTKKTKRLSRNAIIARKLSLLMDKVSIECEYCEDEITDKQELTVDHVVPLAQGGTNDIDNLVLCCRDCNLRKNNLLLTEYIKKYNIRITKKIAEHL